MATTLMDGREVKRKVELIYFPQRNPKKKSDEKEQKERAITGRTWRKWKRICGIAPTTAKRGDVLTEVEVKKLICLAYLKRRNPRRTYKYGDVITELYNPCPDWQARLNAIAYAPPDAILTPAYGKDLPGLIQRLTGYYNVQLESIEQKLRRVAKKFRRKFSRTVLYSANQVSWWITNAFPESLAAA